MDFGAVQVLASLFSKASRPAGPGCLAMRSPAPVTTPVTIEANDSSVAFTTFGYLWGPSENDLVPVRLALSTDNPDIRWFETSAVSVMPLNRDVVWAFEQLCAPVNLAVLARVAQMPAARVVELCHEVCAYRTERCPSGGRRLEAAAVERLSALNSSTSGGRTRAKRLASGRRATPGALLPRQRVLTKTTATRTLPRVIVEANAQDEDDENWALPCVYRQVSQRTMMGAQCLSGLRDLAEMR